MTTIHEWAAESWFPADVETERRMIGALLVALPSARAPLIAQLREPWFWDPFHRHCFRAIAQYREADGQELLQKILTPACRQEWSEPFRSLVRLFQNEAGDPVCGMVDTARRYIGSLRRVYDRRTKLLSDASTLEDTINGCRDSIPVV